MDTPRAIVLLLILFATAPHKAAATSSLVTEGAGDLPWHGREAVRAVQAGLAMAGAYFASSAGLHARGGDDGWPGGGEPRAWGDCVQLYGDSDQRLRRLVAGGSGGSVADARTWLSGAITGHRTCTDGLRERGLPVPSRLAENVTGLLTEALRVYGSVNDNYEKNSSDMYRLYRWNSTSFDGFLVSWDPSTAKDDIVVAQDGSFGGYKTINEALSAAQSHWKLKQNQRIVMYVKAGVYAENVDINRSIQNVMLVGDGIDKTIVTGSRNVPDGFTTYRSATFGVSGDGFWARDMTFENTAGPGKHQAVALRVSSDLTVFYQCSFRGYQDTLFVQSLRQFYRDCDIYGTIDFIFGNAATVLQNCNIYVRQPMGDQSNIITAQGRGSLNENTGISIHKSRILPAQDFQDMKHSFNSYLGRPWQKYSKTIFMETELDGLVSPKGWVEWNGDFALNTLYYGEYMNTGEGSSTANRVNWVEFHVLKDPNEAILFTVSSFIQGQTWLPSADVPFWGGL